MWGSPYLYFLQYWSLLRGGYTVEHTFVLTYLKLNFCCHCRLLVRPFGDRLSIYNLLLLKAYIWLCAQIHIVV